MKRVCAFVSLIALIVAAPVYSQGFRTNVVGSVILNPAEPEGMTVSLRYNEAVAVSYPTDSPFIQGIEFELRIPKAIQGAESSVAWSIFSRVTPMPAPDRLDYSADLVATQPLPSRVSLDLVVPTIERHSIKNGPFASLIPIIVAPDKFPLVYKLTPIGKGTTSAMEMADFKLTIRPVLSEEGGIKVTVTVPDATERPMSVFVDDKRVEDIHSLILAKRGARVVRVSAEGYREEVMTVAVEAGKIVPVSVNLTPNAPLLVFQAPAGTLISIDGQTVHQNEMSGLAVDPGEHALFFRIGDYSMTRKFMALRGKTYQVILSVELDIVTSP